VKTKRGPKTKTPVLPSWKKSALRRIPATEELIQTPEITELLATLPRQVVIDSVRLVLNNLRESIITASSALPVRQTGGQAANTQIDLSAIIDLIKHKTHNKMQSEFRRAINATGIVLHTSLGRAVLAPQVLEALKQELSGYTRLAVNMETGKRLDRDRIIEELICEITGAEAATIANNNAAATVLILNTLAKGKEVICSRGQMVEIGGSFRIPDIMETSGAQLVSIGTTNRTHLRDYAKAITKNTGAILRVHNSNYRIVGFTNQVPIRELVQLGHKHKIPVIDDLGSGALVDLSAYGLKDEPLVAESIKAGADVICFSADKLMGGPQGGVIIGQRKYMDIIRKNPLARAFRMGKLSLIALETTLKLFRDKDTILKNSPSLKMLTTDVKTIETRALGLRDALANSLPAMEVRIIDELSQPGSGSLAGYTLPTKCLAVKTPALSAQNLAARLRQRALPIFTRIKGDQVILDLRTIFESEETEIIKALTAILS
jgi:L-seryl-tRNA(Ser) seleniumtransferase